jgi:hypothetical protein
MSENSATTRDNIVIQKYLDSLGAAQKLLRRKKAQQNAAPTL